MRSRTLNSAATYSLFEIRHHFRVSESLVRVNSLICPRVAFSNNEQSNSIQAKFSFGVKCRLTNAQPLCGALRVDAGHQRCCFYSPLRQMDLKGGAGPFGGKLLKSCRSPNEARSTQSRSITLRPTHPWQGQFLHVLCKEGPSSRSYSVCLLTVSKAYLGCRKKLPSPGRLFSYTSFRH